MQLFRDRSNCSHCACKRSRGASSGTTCICAASHLPKPASIQPIPTRSFGSAARTWEYCSSPTIATTMVQTRSRTRSACTPPSQACPVFTIGDVRSVAHSAEYANHVIDRLLRYLLELDTIRGTGRLYLP